MLYALNGIAPQLLPSASAWQGWVADNATVIGHVLLNDQVSIWFGAVLRGDNDAIHIGQGSNIQENSVLHVDTGKPLHIGAHVTVGHNVTLHGCTIGDDSLIGMNAVVLNGARIGKGCIIGAHALVPEDMVIEDYSVVVGAPAKVIKRVTLEQQQGLRLSALHYIEKAQQYRQQLIPCRF